MRDIGVAGRTQSSELDEHTLTRIHKYKQNELHIVNLHKAYKTQQLHR